MHEMSICESLLQVIEEQATKQRFNKVKTVFVEVGAFAGIEIDALTFCFDVVCKHSIADGAKLEIIECPGLAWCFECKKQVNVSDRLACCPECAGVQLKTEGGDEMRIKELEVI